MNKNLTKFAATSLILFSTLIVMSGATVAQSTAIPDPLKSVTSDAEKKAKALQAAAKQAEEKAKALANSTRDVAKKAGECGIVLTVFKLPGTDAVLDDFGDILRNQCQVDDISKVQSQMEQTKKAINQALIKCDANSINTLQNNYAVLEFELYFVRNFVDTKDGQYIIKNTKDLEKEAENYLRTYTNLQQTEITIITANLTQKYSSRLIIYKDCGPFKGWEKVSERFAKLVKSIEQASTSFTQTAESLGTDKKTTSAAATKTDKETQKAQAKKDAIKRSTAESVKKYLGEHIGINAPAQPDRVVGSSDLERMKITIPGASQTGGESISQVTADINKSQYIFKIDQEISSLKSRYDILYGEAGDSSINDLLSKLDKLNKTIEDTNKKVLPITLQCLAMPNEKQCTKIK